MGQNTLHFGHNRQFADEIRRLGLNSRSIPFSEKGTKSETRPPPRVDSEKVDPLGVFFDESPFDDTAIFSVDTHVLVSRRDVGVRLLDGLLQLIGIRARASGGSGR